MAVIARREALARNVAQSRAGGPRKQRDADQRLSPGDRSAAGGF